MAEKKKIAENKSEQVREENEEPILTGTIVPKEHWEDHARYMREVVNPDDT